MKKSLFIIFLLGSCAFAAIAQTRTSVRILPEIKVENDLLTLGNIAQISESENSIRLRSVALGYAPNIGMTRELTKDKIILAISAAGFSPKDFSLDCPPLVHIERAGQQISQSKIREAVEQTILNQFSENKIEARLARLDLPENIVVPVGAVDIRANISNIQNLFAPFSLSIEVRVNDSVVRRLSANVEIEAYADILVAAKDLPTDAKISEADVRLEKKRIEKPLANYLRDTEKLRGIKLIKNLSSGAELTTDVFVTGFVVRAGDLIRIVGQSGKMQITVSGEARTGGKIGDRIAVKNSQSKSVIQATVVDEGLVKVFF